MDRAFWRIEARRVRAEGRHLIDLADDIETTAREAVPGWNEPPRTEKPSAVQVLAGLLAIGIAGIGLGLLAYFRHL